ncbi:MAG: type III-A CRISPR-associated RAMP protein Csm3 [Bacteroidales bacterium]|nr:type III-A CRISPR-associated RAMP protein Csm3 [Bacteroidales bacterium]
MERLTKKIRINTTLELLTGLHIGGSSDNIEIGGIDSPVIKLKDGVPYIPGSSLKGKIRCLLEQKAGKGLCKDEKVNSLFGNNDNKNPLPSKVIFRDAYLTKESFIMLKNSEYLSMPFTELKAENSIDRTGKTKSNPRFTERIPAGVKFDVEFVINIWDNNNEQEFKQMLKKGIALLENDYLGGSGSRGYGQVKFSELKETELSDKNNWGV